MWFFIVYYVKLKSIKVRLARSLANACGKGGKYVDI